MNWIWAVGAPLVRAVIGLVFRVRIEGVEHVPRTGAVILAPNHVSVIDGPAVSAVTAARIAGAPPTTSSPARCSQGSTGWILRQARQIPIRRGTGDTGALDAATRAIQDGWVVGIFPEGRVNEDPRGPLQRIRSGLTRVAVPTSTARRAGRDLGHPVGVAEGGLDPRGVGPTSPARDGLRRPADPAARRGAHRVP